MVMVEWIVGFGGVLNMGSDVCGWCYLSELWLKVGVEVDFDMLVVLWCGCKLVV